MAGKRKRPNGWEYVIKRAGVLDKPIYLTFENESEGDAYVKKVEALLDRGIVPGEFRQTAKIVTIMDLVREYERDAHPSVKDRGALGTIAYSLGGTRLTSIDAHWVDEWISGMKRVDKLAPGTIRAKVGALARATDWGMRKGYLTMPDHPLRTLPDGYAQYTKTDAALAGEAKTDGERDRRLEPGEYERILEVMDGGVLERKQRPLTLEHVPALRFLFVLAVESGMRLREMYTLSVDQVDLAKRTVFLDKTKNGDKRQVPLSSVALAGFKDYLGQRELPDGIPAGNVFPWWDGNSSERALKLVTNSVSKIYHNTRSPGIFDVAGCVDLHFHDLRHEAVSRLFERTNLSEAQIMKISGHKSHRMMMRYANLRGSDLAEQLW